MCYSAGRAAACVSRAAACVPERLLRALVTIRGRCPAAGIDFAKDLALAALSFLLAGTSSYQVIFGNIWLVLQSLQPFCAKFLTERNL